MGKGLALVDPKILGELQLNVGDVLKLRGKKGITYVKLSEGLNSDYGRKIIRVDGYTRGVLESGIDDHIMISPVEIVSEAKEVQLIPLEELEYTGFKNSLGSLLDGRVISKSDTIPINLVGKKNHFFGKFHESKFKSFTSNEFHKILDWYILRRIVPMPLKELIMRILVELEIRLLK